MRKLVGILACVALSASVVAAQVTPEELAVQAAAVAAAQAELDSLTCLYHAGLVQAEVDSNAVLAGVVVGTGSPIVDPYYLEIVVPYADWDPATKSLWRLELRQSGVEYITKSPGYYSVHRGNARAFLAVLEQFIVSLEEE